MHALVAATLGYGSTHKEPFDKLEKGGTLLWPGQSDQVLRNDASGSTVEVSAPADAAWGEHATTGGRFTGAHRRQGAQRREPDKPKKTKAKPAYPGADKLPITDSVQHPSPLELEYAKDAHPSHPGWDDVRKNSDGRELQETAPKPSVYVYPLPHNLTGAHLYANLTANDHNFHFAGEYIFWQTLREKYELAPPEKADVFFVPVMMTQAFAIWRSDRKQGAQFLQAWNAEVIAFMRSVGPWWDTRRHQHAIFSQRCGSHPVRGPSDRVRKASLHLGVWPALWESNATLLCFEPATLRHLGHGVLLPYGVGGACEVATPPVESRPHALYFTGSPALGGANNVRTRWINEMRGNAPACRLNLLSRGTRKHFNLTAMLEGYASSRFSLGVSGHVGPRKAMFDSIRCGALLLFASDHTPLPFSDEIDYDAFALRVPEGANVNATVAAVGAIPPARLRRMAAAMARAAPLLDYRDGLVDAALRHVVKVAASWSPQNYFNACKTPVASRSPRALRPVYASSECEAVEPASASIRCQDETQPI